jgi:hypothetical protein
MKLSIWTKKVKPSSILIIRSCPEPLMKKLIDDIHSILPEIQIDLIVQKGYISPSSVRNIFEYEKSIYNIFNINWSLLKKMRSTNYDAVIIPCSNNSGKGYFNVKLFSLPIRTKFRFLLFSNHTMLFFSRRSIVMEYLYTKILRYLMIPIRFIYYYATYHCLRLYKKLKINLH